MEWVLYRYFLRKIYGEKMLKKWKMKLWDDCGKPIDKVEGSLEDIEREFKKLRKQKLGM